MTNSGREFQRNLMTTRNWKKISSFIGFSWRSEESKPQDSSVALAPSEWQKGQDLNFFGGCRWFGSGRGRRWCRWCIPQRRDRQAPEEPQTQVLYIARPSPRGGAHPWWTASPSHPSEVLLLCSSNKKPLEVQGLRLEARTLLPHTSNLTPQALI